MKKLLLITALILSCQILSSQIKTDYELLTYDFNPVKIEKKGIPESVKVIGIIAGEIILSSLSDAMYDNGNKISSKIVELAGKGLLAASPWILDIDKTKWHYYIITHLAFRLALYDLVYNSARGLPLDYIGTTSYSDRIRQEFDAPLGMQLFGKSIFLVVAISIPINNFDN